MIAAIYARKSTDQNLPDAEKSVTRQVEHSRAYATRKGWVVGDEHVFTDDGISGAVFGAGRPGLARLLNALAPRPPFQVLIMSEESRLGREAIETGWTLKQIIDAGVRVFFYLDERERTLDSAMDKVMLSLSGFASEMEREKAKMRTFDAQIRKARRGYVTCGKTYGYRNVPVDVGGLRSHVKLEVEPDQAAVVRRVFDLYAEGRGSTAIAATLNADGIRGPRGRTWGQSAVRGLLVRETYRGIFTWGKLQTTIRKGKVTFVKRPEKDWIRLEQPGLRIIAEPLWDAVQARRSRNARTFSRRQDGRLRGRAIGRDLFSEYLWPGLARCGVCGGNVRTLTVKHGRPPKRYPVRYYVCGRNQEGGAGACSNGVRVRHAAFDTSTLHGIKSRLQGAPLEAAVHEAVKRLQTFHEPVLARLAIVDHELAALDLRIARAVDAMLDGETALPEIRGRLVEYRDRRAALQTERETLARDSRLAVAAGDTVLQEVRQAAAEVLELLGGYVAQARQILRALLEDRLDVTPVAKGGRQGWSFAGNLVVGRLLSGEVLNQRDGQNLLRLMRELQVAAPPPPRRSAGLR